AGGGNSELLYAVDDMPALMAWADVAIAAGGSSGWELAFMGLPAVLVTVAENQRLIAESLQRAGTAVHLGWHTEVTPARIAEAVRELLSDRAQRQCMSQAGRLLVDGKGAARVVAALWHEIMDDRVV